MAMVQAEISVRVAWWCKPYLWLLKVRHAVTGREPDFDKVESVLMRGIKPMIEVK